MQSNFDFVCVFPYLNLIHKILYKIESYTRGSIRFVVSFIVFVFGITDLIKNTTFGFYGLGLCPVVKY